MYFALVSFVSFPVIISALETTEINIFTEKGTLHATCLLESSFDEIGVILTHRIVQLNRGNVYNCSFFVLP